MKICNICGKIFNISKFYTNGYSSSGKKKIKPMCKLCFSRKKYTRHWNRIRNVVGKFECSICGYDKNIAAIEFHHIKGVKEKSISDMINSDFEDLKLELSKCIMLCSNCHREIHNKDKFIDKLF